MNFMPESELYLKYSGQIDQNTIEQLLKKFKNEPAFIKLDKRVSKRVYFILVECMENILKYSVKISENIIIKDPEISVKKDNGKIIIKSSNTIKVEETGELIRRLNQVNNLDNDALKALFEETINAAPEQSDYRVGLGFMMKKQRSADTIDYNFTEIDNNNCYFEYTITVNE